MTEKIKIKDLPTFDIANYLTTKEDIATYLTIIIEEGDASELAYATGSGFPCLWHGRGCKIRRNNP